MKQQPQLLWYVARSPDPARWRLVSAENQADVATNMFDSPRAAVVDAIRRAAWDQLRITSVTPIGEEIWLLLTPAKEADLEL